MLKLSSLKIDPEFSAQILPLSFEELQQLEMNMIRDRKLTDPMEMQKLKPYHIENLYTTLSKTPCGSYVEGKKQELTEKQKQRFLSGTTIHEVHRLLGTAFQYAVEWGILRRCEGRSGHHRTRHGGYAGERLRSYPAVLSCGAWEKV